MENVACGLNTTDHLFGGLHEAVGGRFLQQMKFLAEAEKLKTIVRATPLLDQTRFENDAEHTWQLSLMAMLLHEYAAPAVDLAQALKMLIVHDLVEVYAGDTPLYDEAARATQTVREAAAAERIFGILPDDQGIAFKALWQEFEAGETVTAKFANAIDRLQPFLHNYLTGGDIWRTMHKNAADLKKRIAPLQQTMPILSTEITRMIDHAAQTGMISA